MKWVGHLVLVPALSLIAGAGFCAWFVLDPPELTGAANAGRYVALALGVLMVLYGAGALVAEYHGHGLVEGPIRWPLVMAVCFAAGIGFVRWAQIEEAKLREEIDRGVDELHAFETRDAARMSVKAFISARGAGDGGSACDVLADEFRQALESAVRRPCAKAVLIDGAVGISDAALAVLEGDPIWVQLSDHWEVAEYGRAGPVSSANPTISLVLEDGEWRIAGFGGAASAAETAPGRQLAAPRARDPQRDYS